jgi:hypothetical protein
MEGAVDYVEEKFFVRVQFMLFGILKRYGRAEEHFAEVGFVEREGNAIGRRGILKKSLMESCDFFLSDEIERNFIADNVKKGEQFARCRGNGALL